MSETFISDIITNIMAAAIALATGSVEGEGEETAEPAQEPTQVRTLRAYEIKCRSHAEKKQRRFATSQDLSPQDELPHNWPQDLSPQDELPHNWPPTSPASTQYFETSSTESEVEMDVNESHNEYVERKRKRDEMRCERGEDDDDA